MGNADSTQELEPADILEVTPRKSAGSVHPVVLDGPLPPVRMVVADPREATASVLLRLAPRRDLRAVVAIAMVGAVVLLVFAALHGAGGDVAPVATSSTAEQAVATSTQPAPSSSASGVPWAPVGTTPTDGFSGTVNVAAGVGPVAIDGARTTSRTQVLPCGEHTVKIGKSTERKVVVPCGGTVTIDRWGKATTKY